MESIRKLLELSTLLPRGLQADWRNTNHYELGSPISSDPDECLWLDLTDIAGCRGSERPMYDAFNDKSVIGQRIGLLLDIAEALKAAEKDIKDVIEANEMLRRELALRLEIADTPF